MNVNEMISNSRKKTLVRVYLNQRLFELRDYLYDYVIVGEWDKIHEELVKNDIKDYEVECICVNSALDLLDVKELNSRIEYGAIIREHVVIEEHVIVLMGAIINAGCRIGKNTMIDMNAVLGSNVVVKENCHIGANAVLAGTVEPYCEVGVSVDNNSFIGAGAVILEGVQIGKNCIIGANAVVKEDVPDDCIAVGVPARILKKSKDIIFIDESLRKIE
ncbi:MAG: DapH/DapD/GlmU-related protein [Traorella sp.]